MRIVAIIQARMSSSRLPGKVLKTLDERTALEWVVRAARAIPGVDAAVVATSEDASDDAIVAWCAEHDVACHRGPLDDVLGRYLVAARAENADVVMRLTADCPLLDPHVCGDVVALFLRERLAYASNLSPPTWPDGLSCELMTRETLETAGREAARAYEREHVTPFIRDHRHRFPQMGLPCPVPGVGHERWTLDEERDLTLLRELVRRLPDTSRPPAWTEVLAIVEAEPSLREINAGIVRNAAIAKSLVVETTPNRGTARSAELLGGDGAVVLSHGYGSRVWDVDGTPYVDLDCGGGTVVLGHQDAEVDATLRARIGSGLRLAGATAAELDLADALRDWFPNAEALRLFASSSEALRLAPEAKRVALLDATDSEELILVGEELGNGLSIAALIGPAEDMPHASAAEPDLLAVAAATVVLRKLKGAADGLRARKAKLLADIGGLMSDRLVGDVVEAPESLFTALREHGVYCEGRISISAAHSEGDLTVALRAFERALA
ncbi:MAG TPA: hypothetical protein VL974_07855 [Magnetospirillum sp.]|jgi:glutamate-1-semialdehyde 2,1-aminomutase/spore coat polysaccharide biosynthesis protein SpsF|nr:hypothetical protein [Magnetospirillum sp.]